MAISVEISIPKCQHYLDSGIVKFSPSPKFGNNQHSMVDVATLNGADIVVYPTPPCILVLNLKIGGIRLSNESN